MVTTYKHMKYPEPVTLVDPETQTVRTGIAVAYCKGRVPSWFKIRLDNATPGRLLVAYHVDACQIRFVDPPASRPSAMPTFNDAYVIPPTCVELPHWTLDDPIVKGGAEFFAGSGRLSATVEATTGITPMIRIDFNATPPDHRHWGQIFWL